MSVHRLSIADVPEELELSRDQENIVGSEEEALEKIWQKLDGQPSEVSLITISGLCGGCKSTLSTHLQPALKAKGSPLAEVSLNGNPSEILALDYLMSVERGQEKLDFLQEGSVESVRAQFFRVQELVKTLRALVANDTYETRNAYDSANHGRHTGQLTVKRQQAGPQILLAEGTVAKAAAELALESIPEEVEQQTVGAINMVVYTDPAVALLNTVKRGVEKPDRQKDPEYAFREFLQFNKILLPGYIELDNRDADIILDPHELNRCLFEALVHFFANPGYEHLPNHFIDIVEEQADVYPNQKDTDDATHERHRAIIDAYNRHIIAVLKQIATLIDAEEIPRFHPNQ